VAFEFPLEIGAIGRSGVGAGRPKPVSIEERAELLRIKTPISDRFDFLIADFRDSGDRLLKICSKLLASRSRTVYNSSPCRVAQEVDVCADTVFSDAKAPAV
jgi:hypothetical protein